MLLRYLRLPFAPSLNHGRKRSRNQKLYASPQSAASLFHPTGDRDSGAAQRSAASIEGTQFPDPRRSVHIQRDSSHSDPTFELDEPKVGRVIRFDSFSGIMSAGLRMGFASGPLPLLAAVDRHVCAKISVIAANN